jgi:hypothetical protein
MSMTMAIVTRLPGDRQAQIRLHLTCLRRVLDAARAFLLGNLVETYLPLADEERNALRVRLEQDGDVTMHATELTWADQISLRARREDIRRRVQLRFGRVSPEVGALIEGVDSDEAAGELFDRVFAVQTESDLLPAAQ